MAEKKKKKKPPARPEDEQIRHSIARQLDIGHFMEPAIKAPLLRLKMGEASSRGPSPPRESSSPPWASSTASADPGEERRRNRRPSPRPCAGRHLTTRPPPANPVWTPLVASASRVWFLLA